MEFNYLMVRGFMYTICKDSFLNQHKTTLKQFCPTLLQVAALCFVGVPMKDFVISSDVDPTR